MMVDQDYKKNKVTVCAHLQNIYNSYVVKRGRPTLQMNNYYDVDKMNNKYAAKINAENSPTKDQKRDLSKIANISPEEPERRTENYLLTKSASTCHIPDNQRAQKIQKRHYANFDKEMAIRMFGYRVLYQED